MFWSHIKNILIHKTELKWLSTELFIVYVDFVKMKEHNIKNLYLVHHDWALVGDKIRTGRRRG